jgi:hypothetical protein
VTGGGLEGDQDRHCEPLPFMDWPPPHDADPRTLACRNHGECAWPLGPAEAIADYRTLYCCAPVERGQSYCPAHRLRAYAVREPHCESSAPPRHPSNLRVR